VNKDEPVNTSRDLSALRNPYEQLQTGANRCFLCGSHLGEARTQEHIFPKWLQRRYDLLDQRIDLLNGTGIPYRQMKVPCCVPPTPIADSTTIKHPTPTPVIFDPPYPLHHSD
jgi:hypothetical protein